MMYRALFLFPSVAVVVFALAGTVSAAVFETGEEYTLDRSELVSEDLYAAGGSVLISGTALADVIAAGGKVLVNGTVRGDLQAAGGTVDVLGIVSDDARVAGGQIVVGAPIGDDLLAAGGTILIPSGIAVGGDAVLAGGRVVVEGTIAGDVRVYAGEFVLHGTLGREAKVFVSDKLVLGEGARIAGNFEYRAPMEIDIPEGVVIGGEVTFKEIPSHFAIEQNFLRPVLALFFIMKLFALLVASLLLLFVFRSLSMQISVDSVSSLWKNLLVGFVLLIVAPVLTILLLVSVLGFLVGVAIGFVFAILLLLAGVYGAFVLAALLRQLFLKTTEIDWKWVVLGVLVLQFSSLIPILGVLLCLFFFLVALGALARIAHERFWVSR